MISQIGFLQWRLFGAIAAAFFNLSLLVVCGLYIRAAMTEPRWQDIRGNQLALGITCHMIGEALRSSWGAALLFLYAHGFDIGPLENAYPIAFIGQCISAAGILCKLRVLSPRWMAQWLWIAVMVGAIISGGVGISQM